MAGTLLGPDQVRKLNAAYPALVAHIRELLAADHTGVGLMRVHSMVESFDSDEMARIFRELSFISPKERLALVRAAIYELMASDTALFVATRPVVEQSVAPLEKRPVLERPQTFTPPQFNLNVNKSAEFHGQAPADTPPPAPVVTSTHQSTVAARVEEGNKRMMDHQSKLYAAVEKLREASAVQPITIMDVPEDANLQAPVEE